MEGYETGKSSFSKLAYYNSLGEIEADNTKTRFIDEKYNNKNISNIAPESSKTNPKHRNLDNYLQNKTTLDKIKDGIYNYFKSDKGEYDYEINQETISQDKEENNSKMDVGRHINEQSNSNESSFSMQNNQTWQQYLDKNFKPTGTRTSMQEILPTAKKNTKNVAPTAKDNVLHKAKKKLNPTEIANFWKSRVY